MYASPDMINKDKRSHLMQAIQLLLVMDSRPEYKIAADVGVSPSTIRNIRCGKHNPNVVIAEHIYEKLSGYSLGDFDL